MIREGKAFPSWDVLVDIPKSQWHAGSLNLSAVWQLIGLSPCPFFPGLHFSCLQCVPLLLCLLQPSADL